MRPEQIWNLRWPMLLVGAATVAVGCLLVRRMVGNWGLLPAAVVLATDPALIFSSRIDSADLGLPRFFLLLSLILLLRFWKTARRVHLAGAFATLGLACTNPASAALAAAIAIAGLIALRPEVRAVIGWRNLWPSAIGLAAGLLPLLAKRGGNGTTLAPANPLRTLDGSAWFGYAVRQQPGTWGVGPRTWAEERLMAFARAFGAPQHDMLAIGLLAALFAGTLLLLRSHANRRAITFSMAAPIGGYLALAAVGSHAAPPAWCLLTPFAGIAIAVVLTALARRSLYGVAAAIALVATFGLSNLAVTATFYSSALLYGGTTPFTEATYKLADDLDVRDARDLCVLNPGTATVLQFLRHRHEHLVPPPGAEDALYVSGTDEASVKEANNLAAAAHRKIIPVRYVQDFHGRAVFVLYRME